MKLQRSLLWPAESTPKNHFRKPGEQLGAHRALHLSSAQLAIGTATREFADADVGHHWEAHRPIDFCVGWCV